MLRIGILAGDDIGAEVVPQAVKVMKAAALKTGWISSGMSFRSGSAKTSEMGDAIADAIHTA